MPRNRPLFIKCKAQECFPEHEYTVMIENISICTKIKDIGEIISD